MAAAGSVNISLHHGNREAWTGGRVEVVVLDAFSDTRKIIRRVQTRSGKSNLLLRGLPADRGQNYAVLASARAHREAGIYPVKSRPNVVTTAALMLIRKDPKIDLSGFSFSLLKEQSPSFHQALADAGIEELAFRKLPAERIAGALNIEAKLRQTTLAGVPAVQFIRRVGGPDHEGKNALHQDRLYAWVDSAMPEKVRAEVAASGAFMELPEWGNEVFHAGYPLSFKQRLPFGSLQLSFAQSPGPDGLLAADIDIDLFTDIGHLGEVVRNKITRQKTDPYTVYVQLFDQKIFPLYSLHA